MRIHDQKFLARHCDDSFVRYCLIEKWYKDSYYILSQDISVKKRIKNKLILGTDIGSESEAVFRCTVFLWEILVILVGLLKKKK